MNTEKSIIYGINELDVAIDYLMAQRNDCQVFAFNGVLGAGKTTLVQRLLRRCGIEGVITSPTFTYVNIYKNDQGQTFYHFDCYRIDSVDAFIEAGFEEYLFQPNSWAFIEWPDVIKPLLTHNVCYCTVEYHGDDKRKLTCTVIE